VDARIARPGEEDAFIVRARAGERLVAEIVARRLDSPLDARLELRGPDGRPMARNDDWEDPSEGLLTHHADPRLEFTAPTTGDYRLAVTDAQGRGGPGFAYRLVLRPLTPDFALRVTPSAVNIPAGGTATVMVHVLRKDGFTGAVALELAGDRHRLDGGRVPSDVSALPVTITAAPSLAPGTVTPLVLTGRAEIAGLPVTRTAGPCDDTMQAFLWRHLVPAAGWLACATARGPQLQADDTATLRLRPGTTTTVRVRPATRAGPVERPTAELIGAPAGVTVAACRTRGPDIEVDLAVAADLPDGPRAGNIVLLLSGARPARAGGGTPPARPLGVVPARPCELVAPQPRAAG
jgi:hypothetical protein